MKTAAEISEEESELGYDIALSILEDRYARDPWSWLKNEVVTRDEATQEQRRWPDLPYIAQAVTYLQSSEHYLGFPKSRRMIVSWLVSAWITHRVRNFPNTDAYIISDTEGKAAYLVDKRCAWIEHNLRTPGLRKRPRETRTTDGLIGRITYDHREGESTIIALAAGPDVARAFTASIVFMDECESQERGAETLGSVLALIEQGKKTRLVIVSTSKGPAGPLAKLCEQAGLTKFTPQRDLDSLLLYRVPNTPWAIVPVHYTHDPAKRSAEWYRFERSKYPEQETWQQEMEIDFGATSGSPCYSQYRPGLHLNAKDKPRLTIDARFPLGVCIDFNARPMIATVTQKIDGWERCIESLKQVPGSIRTLMTEFRNRFPAHAAGLIFYGDGTGHASDGHTGDSYWELIELEMRGYPAPVEYRVPFDNPDQKDRIAAMNRLFSNAEDGKPSIIADEVNCPDLVQDWREVVWDDSGRKIKKTSDPRKPYYWRTHASDGVAYKIAREYPIFEETYQAMIAKRKERPRKPQPRRLLGMLR